MLSSSRSLPGQSERFPLTLRTSKLQVFSFSGLDFQTLSLWYLASVIKLQTLELLFEFA